MGKRTHDARIIAAMLANGVTNLLTFNPSDFVGISSITIVHPQDLSPFGIEVSDSDIAIADASHTANYFLTPLIDGISYTSASGRNYFYSGDATPVPTPALLPSLIGLGLNLWRKRRNEERSRRRFCLQAKMGQLSCNEGMPYGSSSTPLSQRRIGSTWQRTP